MWYQFDAIRVNPPCAYGFGEEMDTKCERWKLFSLFVALGLLFKIRWHYVLPLYSICVTRISYMPKYHGNLNCSKQLVQLRVGVNASSVCDVMRCEYEMRFVEAHTSFLVSNCCRWILRGNRIERRRANFRLWFPQRNNINDTPWSLAFALRYNLISVRKCRGISWAPCCGSCKFWKIDDNQNEIIDCSITTVMQTMLPNDALGCLHSIELASGKSSLLLPSSRKWRCSDLEFDLQISWDRFFVIVITSLRIH